MHEIAEPLYEGKSVDQIDHLYFFIIGLQMTRYFFISITIG